MSTRTSAVRAFDQRRWSEIAPLWALLAMLGAGAWIYTVTRARDMGVGPGTMGMAFAFFIAMWVAMMAAMMLPAIGPLAAGEGALVRGRANQGARVSAGLAFGAGFLAPWAMYGMLAFAAFVGTGHLVNSSPGAARWLGVGIFALAGLYQFTPIKRRALEHCRMPMAAPSGVGPVTGVGPVPGGFLSGLRDGAVCVGCCAALMAIFLATGAMSISTMAALAVVIFGEKLLPDARTFTVAVGLVLLGFAVAAAVHPALLGGLHPANGAMPMGGSPTMGGM